MSALSSAQRIRGRRESPPSEAGSRPDDFGAEWAVGDASRASPAVLGDAREASSSGSQRSASSTKAVAPTAVAAGARDAPTESAGRWGVLRGGGQTNMPPPPRGVPAPARPAAGRAPPWATGTAHP